MKSNAMARLRHFHRWAGLLTALPALLIFSTGLILLLRSQLGWLHPPTHNGVRDGVSLSFVEILQHAQKVPAAGIQHWSDISKIEVLPRNGVVKVRGPHDVEVQLDAHTGAVLAVGKRWTTFLIRLHEGSIGGKPLSYLVYLPVTILLLALVVSGLLIIGKVKLRGIRVLRDWSPKP